MQTAKRGRISARRYGNSGEQKPDRATKVCAKIQELKIAHLRLQSFATLRVKSFLRAEENIQRKNSPEFRILDQLIRRVRCFADDDGQGFKIFRTYLLLPTMSTPILTHATLLSMRALPLFGAILSICLFVIIGAWRWSAETIRTSPTTIPPVTIEESLPLPTPISSSTIDIISEAVESTTTGTDLASVATIATTTSSFSQGSSTQFVVLAFDGSRAIPMWKETRAFAKELTANGAPIHFTYFINTSYLLAPQHRNIYHPPHHATGTSPIGFGFSEKDVADRLEQMNGALQDGHEIGCHLTGHYDGTTWSKADWEQEFTSFFDIINQVGTINHLEHGPLNRRALQLPPEGIVGFRAPELGVNANLWPVLQAHHFQYDTSLTGKPGTEPTKLTNGLWEFPLERIRFAGSPTSSLLSMDYNFYFKQSGAKELAKKGTPLWDQYYQEVLTSYRDYFQKSYQGNRAPLYIGHHFSLWNDGVYWEALKTFARETCGQPQVRCVSYKEVMQSQLH